MALLTYPEVLRGKVPFPSDIIGKFPPWAAILHEPKTPHAEVGDSVTLFYPWRVFQEAALHRLEFPLWNPHILGGTPFLAEAQSALFYPLHLLLLIQHPPTLWTVKVLLNMILAGFFTSMFVRSIGGSNSAALMSGIVFSCCGFMTAWQAFSSNIDAAVWLPLIFWTANRLCVHPSIQALALNSVALSMPVLAGHPETAAHVALAACGFAIWRCVETGLKDRTATRRLVWFAVSALLAIGLTAVQIIPTVEWLTQIRHTLKLHWPALPTRAVLAFFSRDALANPNSAMLEIPEWAAYVSPISILLAPVSLLFRPRRDAFYFWVTTLVCFCAIYGWPPIHWVLTHTPVLEGLKNGRLILIADFNLAVLAGLGMTALSRALQTGLNPYLLRISVIFGALLAGLGVWHLWRSTYSSTTWMRSPAATAVFFALGLTLVGMYVAGRVKARSFGLLILVIVTVDMGTFRSGTLPFAYRKEIFPTTPTFDFLKKNADPARFRVAPVGGTYMGNTEMVYGLAAADGYDITLERPQNLLNDFGMRPLDGISFSPEPVVGIQDRRLDLMNLRYLVATTANSGFDLLSSKPDRFRLVSSDGPVKVFENLRALPRAFFVQASRDTIELLRDEKDQLAQLKSPTFDPEKSVILAEVPPSFDFQAESGDDVGSQNGEISFGNSSINEGRFRVFNTRPGFLIISQIFYPGWLAIVDGKEERPLRVDYTFVGVPLSKGTHTIDLVFRPMSFKIGLALSVTSLLVLGSLLIFSPRPQPTQKIP